MPKTAQQCEAIRDETKQRIVDEALRYFARNGFSGTKIGDLSQSIGIAQGTLYRYFASKEELFLEIYRLISNEEEVEQIKLLAGLPLSGKQKIHHLTTAILQRLKDDERFSASVVLNTQLLLEQGGSSLESPLFQAPLYALTAQIVEQGQREGDVVAGDSLKLTDYYWGVVYLYALKRLFAAPGMIEVSDLERTLLKHAW